MSIEEQVSADDSDYTIQRVLACNSLPALEQDVLAPLTRMLEAASGIFVQFLGLPLKGDAIGHVRHVGIGRRAIDEYGEGLYSLDPMVQPALQWLHSTAETEGTAIRLLSDIEGWRDQAHYRRFLERFDIEHVIAVAVMVPTALGPQCLCFGFHRGRAQRPFTAADLQRLEKCVPALTPVVSNLAHREAAAVCRSLLDTLSAPPHLVLDEDLRVRFASPEALQRLGLDDQLQAGGNGLGDLRRKVMDSLGRGNSEGGLGDAARADLQVRTVRWSDDTNGLLVTLDEGMLRGEQCFERGCREFELSSRECEVVRLACLGLQSTDIATRLSIAARTVENHLRSIYAKVGVSSRAQLTARIFKLN